MPIYKSKVDLKSNDLPERLKNPYYHDTDDVRENVAHQNGFYLAVNELTEIDQTPREKPNPNISDWWWFKADGSANKPHPIMCWENSEYHKLIIWESGQATLFENFAKGKFVPAIVPEIAQTETK